jgi:hypothetical protein
MRAIRLIPLAELSNRLNLMIAMEPGAVWAAVLWVGTASHTTSTATRTVTLPGKTITKTVPVRGPTKTVIETVPVPPPPAGSAIGMWSGAGNEVTPAFSAPASGDYIVSWNYSGNVDNSFGSSSATNFSISPADQIAFEVDLPNDIATSGSGSTEITGVTPGHPESFNVQAAGQWTIKAVAAR